MTGEKLPFDIHAVVERIREAVKPFSKAAMFQLADEGYRSVFEQLIACIISIRTRDETTVPVARRLYSRARAPAEIAALEPGEIDSLITESTFHESKAGQIREIARAAQTQYGGTLPCDADVLTSFRGVGIKCANLVLGIACGVPVVAVDIHVHRVTNRWGYVSTGSPEQTTVVLQEQLPSEYRVEINSLLVPFGKHICTGALPKCSTCPVLPWCRQMGVRASR